MKQFLAVAFLLPGLAAFAQEPPGDWNDHYPWPVTTLKVEGVDDDRITLSWTAPASWEELGAYGVYRLDVPVTEANFNPLTPGWFPCNGPEGTEEQVVLTGVPAGTWYFAVIAWTHSQTRGWIDPAFNVTATSVPDQGPPEAVTLRVVASDEVSLLIGWSAPHDDATNFATGAASAYDLRMSRTGPIADEAAFDAAEALLMTFTPTLPGMDELFRVAGLQPGRTYHFRLRCRDEHEGGWSALSNPLEAATTAPTHVNASSGGRRCSAAAFPAPGLLLLLLATALLRRS